MSPPKEDEDPALSPTQTFLHDTKSDPARLKDTAAVAPASERILHQRIGQYRVIRRIGRGGMGIVYEAVHETIGQRVAIKTLNQELSANPAFVKRFLNEARATVIAQHPGLVKVFDYGQLDDGLLYIQMEFLEGETLASRIRKNGRLPVETAVRWARQIASAMHVAHSRDIVHRDLKPDNIFLGPDKEVEGGERVKILDFGLAKILSPQAPAHLPASPKYTSMGGVVGTPAYMAPEQYRGDSDISGKADVYALGVILFEMLIGDIPFSASTLGDLMLKHLTKQPPDACALRAEIPQSLGAILDRMLAKDPGERPSMSEVEAQLHAPGVMQSGRGSGAADPGRQGADRKIWKRNLVVGISVGVCCTAILFGRPLHRLLGKRAQTNLAADMAPFSGGAYKIGSSPAESKAAFLWCQRLVSDGCREEFFARETPQRSVSLSPFLLDRTEVTNRQFADWLNAQSGLRIESDPKRVFAGATLLADLYPNFGSGGIDHEDGKFIVRHGLSSRPVTQVTWYAAAAYCQAHGKRLPTEAEWEYAARSGQRFQFPWGDDEPRCDGVVFARHTGWACGHLNPGPADVGTATQDRSAQGVQDLAGNVSEWVADSFIDPNLGAREFRVVRGGDWHTPAAMCRSAGRSRVPPSEVAANIGFRCAK